MGKLVNLIGAGIGMAVEASSQRNQQQQRIQTQPQPQPQYQPSQETWSNSRIAPRDPPPYSQYDSAVGGSTSAAHAYSRDPTTRPLTEDNDDNYQPEKVPKRQMRRPQFDAQGYDESEDDYNQSSRSYHRPTRDMSSPMRSTQSNTIEYGENYDEDGYDSSPIPQLGKRGPLSLPVLIPQRRPETKDRGWILAYAPLLSECGIDEATFLRFLSDFNNASKSSPYLDAVNLAAIGAGFAPGITPMIVSSVVSKATMVAKATQTNTQTNNFLIRANAELFEPRGLFAMIITWNPAQQSSRVEVGFSSTSAAASPFSSSQSPTTQAQLPRSAPLLIPNPDELSSIRNRATSNGMERTGHFVADYMDRRAQARFASQNPGVSLAPQPQFKSRWGDPTQNDGSLIGVVSGGLISRRSARESSTSDEEKAKRDAKSKRKDNKNGKGIAGMVGGDIMNPGVLFLMISNKPSAAEMDAVTSGGRLGR